MRAKASGSIEALWSGPASARSKREMLFDHHRAERRRRDWHGDSLAVIGQPNRQAEHRTERAHSAQIDGIKRGRIFGRALEEDYALLQHRDARGKRPRPINGGDTGRLRHGRDSPTRERPRRSQFPQAQPCRSKGLRDGRCARSRKEEARL